MDGQVIDLGVSWHIDLCLGGPGPMSKPSREVAVTAFEVSPTGTSSPFAFWRRSSTALPESRATRKLLGFGCRGPDVAFGEVAINRRGTRLDCVRPRSSRLRLNLTPIPVKAGLVRERGRRDESRRGTQECVRHEIARLFEVVEFAGVVAQNHLR